MVVAPLVVSAGDETIRVWTAGCATGEEAYSVAILFLEEIERADRKINVQIFASDMDEGALQTGREGRYPRSIEADISEERLKRFFVDEGTHYRVRREVRDLVLFASHSVLKHPPFMRLDLITCRNLMIYLDRSMQEQLLRIFHYGLNANGHLFLGSAENAESKVKCFVPVDADARIYVATGGHERQPPVLIGQPPAFTGLPDKAVSAKRSDPLLQVHARALEDSAPPSVLVDQTRQILHMSESAGRFILHTEGTFSAKLGDIVRPELRPDLKIGLERALTQGEALMSYPVPVVFDHGRRRVALHISPVLAGENSLSQALVMFLDAGPDDSVQPEQIDVNASGDEVRRLYSDLRAAQDALLANRSEHGLAMENLRAANEELQSINEEYRSNSEELETSKEELQSLNEELQTVNAELKAKLDSISTAHSDLQNLTAATEIGTLFLDAKLRIRMFSPPMADLFNITEMDVGRAIQRQYGA